MFKSVLAAQLWAERNGWKKREDGAWFRPAQHVWFGEKYVWTTAYNFKIKMNDAGKEPFWFFA